MDHGASLSEHCAGSEPEHEFSRFVGMPITGYSSFLALHP
jgi:hypothetical protein